MSDRSSAKRRKLSSDSQSQKAILEGWLGPGGAATEPPGALKALLASDNITAAKHQVRQDLYQLQELFHAAGFRTSIVQSPRLAVSLYKDSCVIMGSDQDDKSRQQEQQEYLLTMLGLHPEQDAHEALYKNSRFRDQYCWNQFLTRLRLVRRKALLDDRVQTWLQNKNNEQEPAHSTTNTTTTANAADRIQQFMALLLEVDPKLRREQLEHELDRIRWYNCTLANALFQQFLIGYHACVVQDVFFKTSHVAKYERITFYLYDPAIDLVKPSSHFIWLPDLSHALQQTQPSASVTTSLLSQEQQGTRAIVQDMITTFWSHLLRHGGYYASATMKEQLSPALERYFLSGLRQDPNVPLKL